MTLFSTLLLNNIYCLLLIEIPSDFTTVEPTDHTTINEPTDFTTENGGICKDLVYSAYFY